MRFYKGRYAIGLYDRDESCATVLDNAAQFAEYAEVSLKAASSALSKVMSGARRYVIIRGRLMSVCLIDMEAEDE